jgi:hypothetical protein
MSKYSESFSATGVTVEAVFNGGFRALGTFPKKDGSTGYKRWTVWSDAQVVAGDVVSVAGLISAKAESYTSKVSGEVVNTAALHVNNAKVEKVGAAPAAAPAAVPASWDQVAF